MPASQTLLSAYWNSQRDQLVPSLQLHLLIGLDWACRGCCEELSHARAHEGAAQCAWVQTAPGDCEVALGRWPAFLKFSLVLAHTAQVHYGGEDSFFVSSSGGGAMGVADGVGGWQESGVNPAGEGNGSL